MMNSRKFFSSVLFVIWGFSFLQIQAQDVRFSQYYASPTYLNPALTGFYDGSFRLTAIYRDQWRGAMDDPFVSYSASGDVRFDVGPKASVNRDAAAGGVIFLRDQVDLIDFTTTFIALTGAYHKTLDAQRSSYLSFGLRFGIGQKGINYENINFQDQFNGIDQYDLSTGEVLPRNNISYPDLALGLHYTIAPKKGQLLSIGLSGDHIIPVDLSFYQDGDPNDPTITFPSSPLYQRYSLDITYRIPVGYRDASIRPRLAYNQQGPFNEAIAGINWRTRLGRPGAGNFLQFGSWARLNNYIDSFQASSLVVLTGIELRDVLIGLSYDMNLTGYQLASRNAFELSITYIGDYTNETYLCPSF